MCSNKKKSLSIVLAVITFLFILKLSYEMKWLDLLMGIIKLEANEDSVQNVSFKSFAFISHAGSELPFLRMMEEKGWRFIKHYGRGMIFDKEGYEILISKSTFFNRYAYYEVTTREIFESIQLFLHQKPLVYCLR